MSLRRLSGTVPFAGQYTSPGAMSQRVSIYQKGTRNTNGTYPADVLFITSWAAFRTLSGRELDQARTITQSVQALITVPYIAGLSEAMTVKIGSGGDTYQIEYLADPDGRQVEQRLYCSLINQTEDN
jgi:SPP1 family predicted phage head-tail adaptor